MADVATTQGSDGAFTLLAGVLTLIRGKDKELGSSAVSDGTPEFTQELFA